MRIVIVANRSQGGGDAESNRALARSFNRLGHRTVIAETARDLRGFVADIAIYRVRDGSTGVSPAEALAWELFQEHMPFLVFPPARENSRYKDRAHRLWDQAGLDQPRWQVIAKDQDQSEISGPVVAKPLAGGRSVGVELFPEAQAALRGRADRPLLLQEFIAPRRLWRVVSSDQEVLWGYPREISSDSGVTEINPSSARDYQALDPALASLAQAMVRALGGGVFGSDVIEDQTGRLLALESNSNFWFAPYRANQVAQFLEPILEGRIEAARSGTIASNPGFSLP